MQVAGRTDKLKLDQWDYTPSYGCRGGTRGKCGPGEWHTIPGFESCMEQGTQSPINIAVDSVTRIEDQSFEPSMQECFENDVQFQLNEHTAEVRLDKSGCKDSHFLAFRGKQYKLLQFHFHSPSENTWDGYYFPMEVHFVHKWTDGTRSEYVVVAAMIAIAGKDSCAMLNDCAHPFFSDIMQQMPLPPFTANNFHSKKGSLPADFPNPYLFLPETISTDYFLWNGSMTTPPCNPGPTHWIMGHELIYVDPGMVNKYRVLINSDPINQLSSFGTIVGKDPHMKPEFHPGSGVDYWNSTLGCNNRPLQRLTGAADRNRKVYYVTSSIQSSVLFLISVAVSVSVIQIVFWAFTGNALWFVQGFASSATARELREVENAYLVLQE